MSLILKALGDKKTQTKCDNCNETVIIDFKYFIDDSITPRCNNCGFELNTKIEGMSALMTTNLIIAFSGLEKLINEMEIFKMNSN